MRLPRKVELQPVDAVEITLVVDNFVDLGVERFVPGHCTGWKAVHRLAAAVPDAFVQPSVGTRYRFG